MNHLNLPKAPACLFVLPSLETGGAERVMVTIANNLNATKSLVTVCADGELRNTLKEDLAYTNLACNRVRRGFIPLVAHIRKTKPDVVISTITHINFMVLMIRFFLPSNTSIIVREATLPSFFLTGNKLKKLIASFGYKFLYPTADLVISPSQRIVDEFRDVFGLNTLNHAVLPNPVNVALLRDRAREDYNKPNAEINFISVARLNWAKGLDRLITIMAHIPSELDWHLTILGEGGERARLEGLIKTYNLQNKISLPGLAENPWSAMASADAFLLPSRWEGLPNVVLESLAVGTPVIATGEAGGIKEIKDRSGDCIKIVNSMEDFLSAVLEVKPKEKPGLGDSLLSDEYSLERVMGKFNVLIRSVSQT